MFLNEGFEVSYFCFEYICCLSNGVFIPHVFHNLHFNGQFYKKKVEMGNVSFNMCEIFLIYSPACKYLLGYFVLLNINVVSFDIFYIMSLYITFKSNSSS